MTTAEKGNASEAAILSAFTSRGFRVLLPFGDGHPFDLVVYLGGDDFLRVQCKTSRLVSGCIGFNSRSTDHGGGPGRYTGLADVFGVYFPPLDSVYVVPAEEVAGLAVQLRLKPTLNNQRKRVRMAADYLIEQWSPGALRKLCRSRSTSGMGRTSQVA
jgi:hypothetical protein